MAIDTPARLAVLGAGPIGLEAALYGRFLGYDVVIYEQGEVAQKVRDRGTADMTMPFSRMHSTLGLAAIEAQDESYQAPPGDTVLTCAEWIERYLGPLAGTDLISEHLRLHTTVNSVEQVSEWNDGTPEESDEPVLKVVARTAGDDAQIENFHGVLDCSGPAAGSFLKDAWQETYANGSGPPNFYLLGSKRVGEREEFPFLAVLEQIREVFAILGDRPTLDLYAGAKKLLRSKCE